MKNFILALSSVVLSVSPSFGDEHSHNASTPGLTSNFAAAAPAKAGDVIPQGAKVFFKNLRDGQSIGTKYLVKFGVRKMKVQPAGELQEGTGHHHLIIGDGPVNAGMVVPADEKHIHFGKAQTEYELVLKPGQYKLTLQFANGAHLSYGPDLSETVSITVK